MGLKGFKLNVTSSERLADQAGNFVCLEDFLFFVFLKLQK